MNKHLAHTRNQTGFSIVELMISLTIGLILLGAVVEIIISSRQTDRGQQAQSRIQENGRYVFSTVGGVLRRAGYRTNGDSDPAVIFPAVTLSAVPFIAKQTIGGTDTMLVLRYQGAADGLTKNCLGDAVPAPAVAGDYVYETISLAGVNLSCAVGTGVAQTLVEDIEQIRFTYSEDTDGDQFADVYRATAADVVNWVNVVSVKMDIVLVSTDDNITTESQAFTFNDVETTPTDNRLRRVMSSTFALRN